MNEEKNNFENNPDDEKQELHNQENLKIDQKPDGEEQVVQVVDTKPLHLISNKEEILKIFQNMDVQEQALNLPQPIIKHKKSSFKRKQFEQKHQKKSTFEKVENEMKKQKIIKLIEPMVKKYKAINCPNFHDSEVNKLKYEGKEKIFKYLMFNIYELRQLDAKNLSQEEKTISDLKSTQAYNYAKKIASEISAYFLSHLNHNSRNNMSKKYKTQWKKIISNIQDENNFEFRTKIAIKQWTPEKLAEADEIQFYPQAKRQFIMQRNKRLINASTVEEKFNLPAPEEQNNFEVKTYEINKPGEKLTMKKKNYKYIEESTIGMIKEFLSEQQVLRMKSMIEKDVKRNEKLLSHISNTFDINSIHMI